VAVDRTWRWIAWLILGIGMVILTGGLALGWVSLRHVRYAERAAGEVIEIHRDGDMYAPVVRFRLPDGEARDVTDLASGAPDFAVGDKVTILYMPQDPGDFRIDRFDRLWLPTIFVTVFGGLWLTFGTVAWALSRNADLFLVGERAFTVIAAVALVVGAFALADAIGLYGSGTRTEGLVVEIRKSRIVEQEDVQRADGSVTRRDVERVSYTPIVHFTTGEGRQVEFHGRGGSGTSYTAGERVMVIYDPANPIRVHILSFVDLWLPSVAAFAVAILFGGPVWLSHRWRRKLHA